MLNPKQPIHCHTYCCTRTLLFVNGFAICSPLPLPLLNEIGASCLPTLNQAKAPKKKYTEYFLHTGTVPLLFWLQFGSSISNESYAHYISLGVFSLSLSLQFLLVHFLFTHSLYDRSLDRILCWSSILSLFLSLSLSLFWLSTTLVCKWYRSM